ncbi:hypothetical protein B0H17DRAFT_1184774 [Mycena rosella]|uniref:VHS domain-containing protein n=1 Tax=Mycena rosella TaxID=1033263 RepID=A0AAD7CV04_MYCRO|nr:hypothetical protein B0H17DRAFT_1184774 [Mycena rosella]
MATSVMAACGRVGGRRRGSQRRGRRYSMTFNALEDDELDSNWPSSALFVCAVLRHFRAEKCQLIILVTPSSPFPLVTCPVACPRIATLWIRCSCELTRKIGFLTPTASEDWTLVLDVCDHASANESNAKEAVHALRLEFKYGEPAAQLAAARIWALMLRNSDTFISQSTSRKFLDTLEDLLISLRTSPVVRERVMDVVAAAAKRRRLSRALGMSQAAGQARGGHAIRCRGRHINPPFGGGRVSAYDYETLHADGAGGAGGGSSSRSRSPSPTRVPAHVKRHRCARARGAVYLSFLHMILTY